MLTYYDYLEKLLVVLRDGRKLIGILRSFDQFGNNHIFIYTTWKAKRCWAGEQTGQRTNFNTTIVIFTLTKNSQLGASGYD